MPIIVENSPSATAWTLTAAIAERQVLINGRHHVLWEELSTNRWVVTTPERRTSVVSLQTASVVSLGRGDLFPGPGRPFLALSLLSAEDWDTHRSAARSLARFSALSPVSCLDTP